MIFLERFILGGLFFLLIIFGIILLCLKDNFVQSPKMHRYLGASVLLTACYILCAYLELVYPDEMVHTVMEMIIAIAAIIVYAYIGCKIASLIIKKYSLVPTPVEKVEEKPEENIEGTATEAIETVEPEAPAAEKVVEPEETEGEGDEGTATEEEETSEDEDDKDATDENGDAVPEPDVNNMEDLIFFQKLEAVMMKKKLFNEPDITREQIAAEIGTNRTYLIRSIKLATGMTFNEYITSLRINYAANLIITTDEPLDYIGTLAGFRSKSAYYRAFAAANNCTPTEYRKKNK